MANKSLDRGTTGHQLAPSGILETIQFITTQKEYALPWASCNSTIGRTECDVSEKAASNSITISKEFAIDCIGIIQVCRSTSLDLLITSSLSASTVRAYSSDLIAFETWAGHPIPATPMEIAEYIAAQAPNLKPATLARRLASLSKAHKSAGYSSPTQSEIVKVALKGLRRLKGTAQSQATPLIKEDLLNILHCLPLTIKGIRDRALLLVGFSGGFRRSELVNLNVEDVEFTPKGMLITIRRSKTDQEGKGRQIAIPFARGQYCPVRALETWLEVIGIENGAIFRPVNRFGRIDLHNRLSGEAVAIVVKMAVAQIGYDPQKFSGHSLRAGLATSASIAGIPSWKIRQTTGHTSDAMLGRYVRVGDLFTNCAAGIL